LFLKEQEHPHAANKADRTDFHSSLGTLFSTSDSDEPPGDDEQRKEDDH